MSQRSGLFADISWFQVAASVLAAVTSAWIASSLGVAGTLIGAALGSFVVTISSAFYARTLDKGKTLIVQTASGAVVERDVEDDEISEAFDEVREAEQSPVERAEVIENPRRRLHWKTIIATAVAVLGISLAAMGVYEVVTGNSFGADSDNPQIGKIFGGGGSGSSDGDDSDRSPSRDPEPSSTPSPTATPTAPSSSPDAPEQQTPAPPAQTPTPAPTTPAPSDAPPPPAAEEPRSPDAAPNKQLTEPVE